MARKILGVILGYVVIAAFIFMTFSGFYFAIGANGAYYPGTYEVSVLWITVSSVLGLSAAVVGGYVCRRISGDTKSAIVLAGIVLGLGLAVAVAQMYSEKPPPEVRTGEISNYEAMKKSQQPLWLAFANPVIGFVGILIGGGAVFGKKEGNLNETG